MLAADVRLPECDDIRSSEQQRLAEQCRSNAACVLSLDFLLLKRFLSLSLFLLLDEPQPRKTNGEDHHHDQNGELYHRNCPELIFTDQHCSSVSRLALDLNQKRFLLFCVPFHAVAAVSERTMAQTTISYLERRHAALESEIADALRQSPADDLAIADLKYRKRIIADEILHNRRLVARFSKLGTQ